MITSSLVTVSIPLLLAGYSESNTRRIHGQTDQCQMKTPNRERTMLPIGASVFFRERREQVAKKFEYRRRVVHCCGHAVNHILHTRNRQEADSWAHKIKRSECPECRARNVHGENGIDKQTCNFFPDLQGPFALVKWAGALRSKIHGALSRSGKYHDVAFLCRYEVNAEWWIEHRGDRFCDIVAHLRELEKGGQEAA